MQADTASLITGTANDPDGLEVLDSRFPPNRRMPLQNMRPSQVKQPEAETGGKITSVAFDKEKFVKERNLAAKVRQLAREANQNAEGVTHIFNENSAHAVETDVVG